MVLLTKKRIVDMIRRKKSINVKIIAKELGVSEVVFKYGLEFYDISISSVKYREMVLRDQRKQDKLINNLYNVIYNNFIVIEKKDSKYSYVLCFEDDNYKLLSGIYKIYPDKIDLKKLKISNSFIQLYDRKIEYHSFFKAVREGKNIDDIILKRVTDDHLNDFKYLIRKNIKGLELGRKREIRSEMGKRKHGNYE